MGNSASLDFQALHKYPTSVEFFCDAVYSFKESLNYSYSPGVIQSNNPTASLQHFASMKNFSISYDTSRKLVILTDNIFFAILSVETRQVLCLDAL